MMGAGLLYWRPWPIVGAKKGRKCCEAKPIAKHFAAPVLSAIEIAFEAQYIVELKVLFSTFITPMYLDQAQVLIPQQRAVRYTDRVLDKIGIAQFDM